MKYLQGTYGKTSGWYNYFCRLHQLQNTIDHISVCSRGYGVTQDSMEEELLYLQDCPRARASRSRQVTWLMRALTCAVTLSDLCVALCASRTVRTLSGAVSGVVVTPHHRDLGAVEVFRGIPYAAPPLRFGLPQPVPPWRGVKTASRFVTRMSTYNIPYPHLL